MDKNYKKQIKYINFVEKDLINKLILLKNNHEIIIKYIMPNIFLNINNMLNCILGIYFDYKYKYNFQYKYEIIENDPSFILFKIIFNENLKE